MDVFGIYDLGDWGLNDLCYNEHGFVVIKFNFGWFLFYVVMFPLKCIGELTPLACDYICNLWVLIPRFFYLN